MKILKEIQNKEFVYYFVYTFLSFFHGLKKTQAKETLFITIFAPTQRKKKTVRKSSRSCLKNGNITIFFYYFFIFKYECQHFYSYFTVFSVVVVNNLQCIGEK